MFLSHRALIILYFVTNKWTDVTICSYLFSAECNNKRLALRLTEFVYHNTGCALWGEAVGRFADTCSQSAPLFPILLYAIIFYFATI